MAAPTYLPSDLIGKEILTRTSLETLDTCKCACKQWKNMIDAPDFMPEYVRRTKNVSGFFIQWVDKELDNMSTFVSAVDPSLEGDLSIGSLPRGMRILGSCIRSGIMCCVRVRFSDRYLSYYICKQTTQQWKTLPPLLVNGLEAAGIVTLGSSPLRYKIVFLCRITTTCETASTYQCHEFHSDSWTWHQTKTINFQSTVRFSRPSLFIHDSFHWLPNDNTILAYNINTQSFRRLSFPRVVYNNKYRYCRECLVEYQGNLGLTCLTRMDTVELWVMVGRIRYYWRRLKEINIGPVTGGQGLKCLIASFYIPEHFYNDDIMFLRGRNEVVFYNIKDGDGNITRVKLEGDEDKYAGESLRFRSDWKPVDLGSPFL